jgi:hypothetical protein
MVAGMAAAGTIKKSFAEIWVPKIAAPFGSENYFAARLPSGEGKVT